MKLKAKVIVGVLSLATLGTLSYFTEKQSMISAKEQVVVATQKEEVKERKGQVQPWLYLSFLYYTNTLESGIIEWIVKS